LGINKGQVGTPGELIGTFASRVGFGQLVLNNQSGVYGKVENAFNYGTDLMLGLKQEIKTGKAYIITTFENQKPQKFEIQIEKVNLSDNNPTKNLVIKITDPALIEKTGGIVQGMSGSPIIQDNKLVGAVTHVFVNDPTRGYGIFAENMYQTAQNAVNN
jgi:stage IV sporulation protein B